MLIGMTVDEAVEQNKARVIEEGVDESEIDENQIKMWKDKHIATITDSPRDTDIPARVLASLPEIVRESLLRTHPLAASNWVATFKIWNKTYRELLRDVQVRARIGETKKMHRDAIKRALSEGKPVPKRVFAEYPELEGWGDYDKSTRVFKIS